MHLNMQSITQEIIPNKTQTPHFSQSNLALPLTMPEISTKATCSARRRNVATQNYQ